MRLEHHLVGGYVRYISPHIIILLVHVTITSKFADTTMWDHNGSFQSQHISLYMVVATSLLVIVTSYGRA